MRSITNQRGFTLVEALITLVIMGVVGVALFQVLTMSTHTVEDQKATLEAQQNARIALNSVAEDFRHVSYGKDATQPSIFYAAIDSVVFVADVFDNPGAEVISYYLAGDGDADTPNPNDRILMKTVTDTAGTVLLSAPQSYGIGSSGFQLRYFNGNGVELPSPVTAPELIGEIRVQVTGVSPRPMQDGDYFVVNLTNTIYPRNLPLTPARSRPNPPGAGGTSIPDCQSMTVHWTAPTTNTDGTELAFNDISHFNFYFGTDPGHLNLNSRLARTSTQWTVTSLTGAVYYFSVTCASRAGVESYGYEGSVDLLSGFQAEQVTNVAGTVSGDNVALTWTASSHFAGGGTITTPVHYNVHRSNDPAFTADTSNRIGSTADGVTNYSDTGLSGCQRYYYRVAAVACGNGGIPSDAVEVLHPSVARCPSNVVASQTSTVGQIRVTWNHPTQRMDGSALAAADIDHYYVYYDTIPGSTEQYVDYAGAGSSPPPNDVTLTGIAACNAYYVNVQAIDACGNEGDLCAANEQYVNLPTACSPTPPSPPTSLTALVGETSVHLTWGANTADCDLDGYAIWYGFSSGATNGVGAAEGNSPILLLPEDITSGGSCTFSLTDLDNCANYYISVTAYDRCSPPNHSVHSNEIVAGTSCVACDLAASCAPWVATGAGYTEVRYNVYPQGSPETVSRMMLTWSQTVGQKLSNVYANGTCVWSGDGVFGLDGNQGPVNPGTTIHTNPFTVSSSYTQTFGYPMKALFTADMRYNTVYSQFTSSGMPCEVSGQAKPAMLLDDFNDGDYNGWTVSSGTWSVASGALQQTTTTGTKWLATTTLSTGEDFIFDCATNIKSGTYTILQFNRYTTNNRYVGMLNNTSNTINLGSMLPGYADIVWTSLTVNPNVWYKMRVEKEGSTYTVYADCTRYLQASIFPLPPAGKFGFGTTSAWAYFDDVTIANR